MGDHRFHTKIEFSIYGYDYKWDASLNWSEEYDTGIDDRIVKWFRECYEDARGKRDQINYEAEAAERAASEEKRERAELTRLQAKYSQANPQAEPK